MQPRWYVSGSRIAQGHGHDCDIRRLQRQSFRRRAVPHFWQDVKFCKLGSNGDNFVDSVRPQYVAVCMDTQSLLLALAPREILTRRYSVISRLYAGSQRSGRSL